MGIVSPIGVDSSPVIESLRAGKSGIQPASFSSAQGFPQAIAGEVKGFDGRDYVRPRKSLKVMCREIQFGVAAADMAWRQAGLAGQTLDPERIGVVLGSEIMYTDLEDPKAAYKRCMENGQFDFAKWGSEGLQEIFPLWMLKYLPNMTACHVGIALDARGPNNTVDQIEVSSLLSLSEGASLIERGLVDVALVGGASSRLNPALFLWRNNEFLAKQPGPTFETSCRPFDAARMGSVHAEGGAIFVLERGEQARARKQTILATLVAAHHAFEAPLKGKYGHFSGKAIRTTISQALQNANLSKADIHHVNAHAMGTKVLDAVEAQAIRSELVDTPVVAHKSYLGNSGAASGALEIACDLASMQQGFVAPHCAYDQPDPECPVNVVYKGAFSAKTGLVLKLSQAVTGQAAAVILEVNPSEGRA